MIERVVFLVVGNFCQRDYRRYGIDILQKNGFNIEVWDLTRVLHARLTENDRYPDGFVYDGLTVFNDEDTMAKKLSSLSVKDFAINMLSYDPWSLVTYKALSRSEANYGVCCANSLPVPEDMKGYVYMVRKFLNLIRYRDSEILKRLYMRLPFHAMRIKPARLVLTGGEQSFSNQYPVDATTEFLPIHAFDYDLFLEENKIPHIEKSIAVFLDDQFALSPEFAMYSEKPNIETERYFSLLNNVFDYVESKLGIDVVIAAHPRSHYEVLPDYFNGRKCIKDQTIKLVKESQLVLAHYSTAINFANLFYKPVIFMTCSEIRNTPDDYWIKEMAKWHGKIPVLMDKMNTIDFGTELKVNREYYKHYRRSYIKANYNEDLPFWEVVSERLRRGFDDN